MPPDEDRFMTDEERFDNGAYQPGTVYCSGPNGEKSVQLPGGSGYQTVRNPDRFFDDEEVSVPQKKDAVPQTCQIYLGAWHMLG